VKPVTNRQPVTVDFYRQPVQEAARDLLGKRLVRQINDQRISGWISETEAYDGETDRACHARSGPTLRNSVMYGEAGRAYVYFTYGMHWMLNCVCGNEGYPAAILIRALVPAEGLEYIASRREGIARKDWCSGPARLTRALSIDKDLNGIPLTDKSSGLYIEEGKAVPENRVTRTPRIGIQYAGEPWVSKPWRYVVQDAEVFFNEGDL
jgi:DNA-3-methyladenine glycosylase